MKKTFHLSVVLGVVVLQTEAAQGQTENARAQTEIELRPPTARFGISVLGI
jgi:hypothetical protein